MTGPDVHMLTGAYVVDALEEFERRQFEAHLAECPDCAREVDELRATAARLGVAVVEQPPEHLRQRVLRQVARTRQDAPVTARTTRTPGAPRPWVTRTIAVAAVVAVLAAVGFGVAIIRTQHQLDTVQNELSQAQATYGPIATVLGAHDTRADTNTIPGVGSATVMASHNLNRAVLMVSGMAAAPARHTYQAWLVGNTGLPRSAGLLTPSESGLVTPLLVSGLDNAMVLKVTVEPAGGSALPTTSPVMWVTIPA